MTEPLTPAEQKLIEQWRALPPKDQQAVQVIVNGLHALTIVGTLSRIGTTPPKE